jgi:hypothetical protein
MEVSGQPCTQASLLSEKNPGCQLNKQLYVTHSRSGDFARINLFTLPGTEARIAHPIA